MPAASDKKTLLLVENEALLAMDEAAVLEQQGYRVVTAYNSEEALQRAGEVSPDLILMDIDLGTDSMDGTETAESILENHDIPIVFLTSHTEPEIVEKTERITSFGYVVKSSGDTVLLNSVKMALRLHDAYRAKTEAIDRFKALYNNAPLPYQSLDEEGCIIDVNPAWCAVLGYAREDVLGKNFGEFLHPDWTPHFKKNFPEFKRRGSVHNIEFRMRRRDGEYRDVSFEGRTGRRADGSFKQTYCVFQDITETKKARDGLAESEAILQEAQEIAGLGSYVWDLTNDDLWWSKNMYTIAGLDPDTFYGNLRETIAKAVHPDDREDVNRQVAAMVEQKHTRPMDFRLVRPDGDIRWVQSRARFFFDAEGNPARAIGVHYDITE